MYCGQFGEPQFVERLFPSNYKGVCIEVGAYDGVAGSNTFFFERYKGWRALCIEPIPDKFEMCKKHRKECVNCCIGENDEDDREFTIFTINGENKSAISGLEPDERLIESHKHMIHNREKINVKVRSLNSLLEELDFPKDIDFVSIDTENTELDVLKGFDLNKYNVKVLCIENNFDEPFHYDYIKQFGYKKLIRLGVNDIYIKA